MTDAGDGAGSLANGVLPGHVDDNRRLREVLREDGLEK